MFNKYYRKSTNLKEIIKEEAINKELLTKINTLENNLSINKRAIFLDKFMFIISILALIVTINISLLMALLSIILSLYTALCYHEDKTKDLSNKKELEYLKKIYHDNNQNLDYLRNNNHETNNYVLDREVEYSKQEQEKYFLNLEKKLLIITYFTKHKNKLIKYYLNNNLNNYLLNKGYNSEDIDTFYELVLNEINNKTRIRKK